MDRSGCRDDCPRGQHLHVNKGDDFRAVSYRTFVDFLREMRKSGWTYGATSAT
jgi:hypothetical protein